MRIALALVGLVAAVAPAHAEVAPVRVSIECESDARTKACPSFLQGFVDAAKVMRNTPRAAADVIVYVATTEVALVDRVHMRFVSRMVNAPAALEIDVDVDSRGSDDEQRAQLQPAFNRGMAQYVAARFPGAVEISFKTPAEVASLAAETGSPWGVELNLNGSGSYTERYRSASGSAMVIARYVEKRFRALTLSEINGSLQRQPPLILEDGTRVPFNSDQWSFKTGAEGVYSFDDTWSLGVGSYTAFSDDTAQFNLSHRSRAALEYDMFPADDPRGNQLGVFYHVGWAVERYNIRNEIGERFAQYPVHGINAVATVRKDKVSFGLNLESNIQLDHPSRRYSLTANPYVEIQLGDHIDFSVSLSLTQRELPAPDPSDIDPSDYEQLSRLSYAEPFSISGSVGITFHWDPTNGVRNNRIGSI